MQEQSFPLVDGETAILTPGVLRINDADGAKVVEFDLAYLHTVERDGETVHIGIGDEEMPIVAASLVDAGRIEAILRSEVRADPPVAQPAPQRRSWLTPILIVVGVVVGLVYFGDFGFGDPSSSVADSPRDTQSQRDNVDRVGYRISSNRPQTFSVSWRNQTGGSERTSTTGSVWQKEYAFTEGYAYLFAVNNDDEARPSDWIECRIEVDGVTVDEERAYGPDGSVSCDATIR